MSPRRPSAPPVPTPEARPAATIGPSTAHADSAPPQPRLIVRIDLGAHGRLGPGKILLLDHIATLGSISAAGRAMNMSYRQAWDLVDQLNHAFTDPVVASQTGGKSGGGAHLTDFGRALVAHYRSIQRAVATAAAADMAALGDRLRPASEARAE